MSDYRQGELSRRDLRPNPQEQFEAWFSEAHDAGFIEANAVALATATSDGRPSCRTILLKDHDERGYTFFTNYDSRKGRELDENPNASLLFFWDKLERQIRIEGEVVRTSAEESTEYYQSRSRRSRLSAASSPQSVPVSDRAELERRRDELEASLEGQEEVPRPEGWGGYRLIARRYEFWQGRSNRLHDRFVYEVGRADGEWTITRLGP